MSILNIVGQISGVMEEAKQIYNQMGSAGGVTHALSKSGMSKEQALSAISKFENVPQVKNYVEKNGINVSQVKSSINSTTSSQTRNGSGLDRFR